MSVDITGEIKSHFDTTERSRCSGWVPDTSLFVQQLPAKQLSRLSISLPCPQSLFDFITRSFTHLRELHIETDESVSIEMSHLNAISDFPQLHSLHIHGRTIELGPEASQTPLAFPTLKKLYIACVPFESIAEHLLQLDVSVLALDFPLFNSLSMENLETITLALPNLTTLHLHCSSSGFGGSKLNNMALLHASSQLPYLLDLALDLNAKTHEQAHTIVNDVRQLASFHPLEKLSLQLTDWDFNSSTAADLALFIDIMFPRLKKFTELNRSLDSETRSQEGEEHNNELIKRFQLSRSIERYRQGIEEITEYDDDEEEGESEEGRGDDEFD
ncbi:hypothetical protein CVT24_006604 [Panaeolus cyanescens]|uniref:F-box domain-containing protein n=1 Tax=Panaeolus cyanescens TaxID=181874 RepID=A0A409WP50_9AGAR|nr:hypothetical protein CVT24_006604 [Panaeolus cyanescens]